MSERMYVALDLETTGLDAGQDAIIEIGAIRFLYDGSRTPFQWRIVDRFVTFVNPQRPIPLRIQQLTGIRNADVESAPLFSEIAPELLAYVSSDVRGVIAHNADFDLGFLRAGGIDFARPVHDTFELATIVLPGMASYSLGELCRQMDIELSDAHRASGDAVATAHLFCHCLQRLEALPPGMIRTLLRCGQGSTWPLLLLLEESLHSNLAHQSQVGVALLSPSGSVDPAMDDAPPSLIRDQSDSISSIEPDHVASLLEPDGALSHRIGALFEHRSGQVTMARRVSQALNTGDHLIIEAGTGTGKSLAYLLPAAIWSVRNQRRVLIATNTIALQDQILEKDIPILQELLEKEQYPRLHYAVFKGRANYLCTRRLHAWFNQRQLSLLELRVLAKIFVWLLHTVSGDVSEVFLPTAAERTLWGRICSDSATCNDHRCRDRVTDPDFVFGSHYHDYFLIARRRADAAHVLVVNHSLLLADIASEGRVLPPYSHLVIDETHRFEEAATEQLTYRVEWDAVRYWCRRLFRTGDLLPLLVYEADARSDESIIELLDELSFHSVQTASAIALFAERTTHFAKEQTGVKGEPSYAQRLSLTGAVRSQPAWSELEIQWERTSNLLKRMLEVLGRLIKHLDERSWWSKEPKATYLSELAGLDEQLSTLKGWMDHILHQAGPTSGHDDIVCWLEVAPGDQDTLFVAAPLYVSDTIEHELVHNKRSVIFTGATLRTGSGFSFIRDRLGLWDVPAATVESPFDYRTSTLLYLPSDMPAPNHTHYQSAVEDAIVSAAMACNGRTLVLFTSYAQLRTTADAIRSTLDMMGITVLQHGHSSRNRLLREYRQTEHAVLLGTRSFWEGIDLPGDELRCLLIVRLPFAVPGDPLVAARTSEMEDSFRDYMLPDAVLRFRQGFGRLIRRSTDRGAVVVLDSRIWRKEYGSSFLESLPTCTMRHAPLANMAHEIEWWLDRHGAK